MLISRSNASFYPSGHLLGHNRFIAFSHTREHRKPFAGIGKPDSRLVHIRTEDGPRIFDEVVGPLAGLPLRRPTKCICHSFNINGNALERPRADCNNIFKTYMT